MNNYYDYNYDYRADNIFQKKHTHTHEYIGSTRIAEMGREAHEHRIAGVSSESIRVPGGHIHEVTTNTTFEDGHIHQVKVRTGIQIPINNEQHVHELKGTTTLDDGHTHNFSIATSAGKTEM
jgi:hypothetical protein